MSLDGTINALDAADWSLYDDTYDIERKISYCRSHLDRR